MKTRRHLRVVFSVLYPRCPECGARLPTLDLVKRHLVRDCCGLPGGRRWADK